jgi:DNA-binding Lrp family transcriptional regulator
MQSTPLSPNSLPDALALLNPWQRNFPLVREPYAVLARQLGRSSAEVLTLLRALSNGGALSRIGGVFSAHAGGAALLSAMAVPPERLQEVAAIVSAHPGVNHNYEREDRFNLWFVMTAFDAALLEQAMLGLERDTGLAALRLPMVRPYRIDLGFDLRARVAGAPLAQSDQHLAPVVADADRALAALLEEGLPLVERPFDVWAQALGCEPVHVLRKLQAWLDAGTLRRFGTIVRHHEFGFDANAMTVFNVPAELVDACGARVAREAGVTLSYRRQPAPGWPYNLYFMVHGTDRAAVQAAIARVIDNCELGGFTHQVLFSRQRFKQTGARRFRALPVDWSEAGLARTKVSYAVA